jgi:hypothetical protein
MEIRNIRYGKGRRSHILYAELYAENGELLIGATLEYIYKRIPKLLKQEK